MATPEEELRARQAAGNQPVPPSVSQPPPPGSLARDLAERQATGESPAGASSLTPAFPSLADEFAEKYSEELGQDTYPQRYRPNPLFSEFQRDIWDMNEYPRSSRQFNPRWAKIEDYSQGQEYSFGEYAASAGKGFWEGLGQVAAAPFESFAQVQDAVIKGVTEPDDPLRIQLQVDQAKSIREFGQRSAIAANIRRLTERDPEDVVPGFWSNDMPVALGQLTGFFAGGIVSGGLRVPGWIGAAWLGQAVGGQGGYDDAIQHGATPDEAAMAYWINAAAGLTEGLPIMGITNRLNKYSGGRLAKILRREYEDVVVRKGVGFRIAKDAARSTLEEGFQEVFQEFVQNATAQDWVGYDPERDLGDNVWNAFKVGGTTGFLLTAATQALGIKLRRNQLESRQDHWARIREARLQNLENPETIWGVHSELPPNYLERRQRLDLTFARLEQLATIEEASHWMQNPDPGFLTFIQGIGYSAFDNQTVSNNPRLQRLVVEDEVQVDGQPRKVRDVIKNQEGGVYMVGFDALLDQTALAGLSPEEQARMLDAADKVKNALARIAKEMRTEFLVENKQGSVLKETGTTNVPIFIHSYTDVSPQDRPGGQENLVVLDANGDIVNSPRKITELQPGEAAGTFIYINTDGLMTHALQGTDATYQRAGLYEHLAHEMGHAVLARRVGVLMQRYIVQDQERAANAPLSDPLTPQEESIAKGFYFMWRNWAKRAYDGNVTFEELLVRQMNPLWARRPLSAFRWSDGTYKSLSQLVNEGYAPAQLGRLVKRPTWKHLGQGYKYWLNPHEFFAQLMARYVVGGRNNEIFYNTATADYFSDVAEEMRRVMNASFGANTTPATFKRMVEALSLHGKITKALANPMGLEKTLTQVLQELPRESQIDYAGWQTELDEYNSFIRWAATLPQLAWLNQHIQPLQNYVNEVMAWDAYRKKMEERANRLNRAWKKLGKEQANRLARVLLDESAEGQWLTPDELNAEGLDPRAIQVYGDVHGHFQTILNEMEETVVAQIKKNFQDEQTQARKLAEARANFQAMRSKPYFPFMRFGKYAVEVRNRASGAMEVYEMLETEKDRDKLLAQLRRRYPDSDYSVSKREVKEKEMVSQGLPYRFVASLESAFQEAGSPLDAEQARLMKELAWDLLPTRSFMRQFKQRRGVEGYSMDGMRSLAAYTMNAAGYLARARHGVELQDHIKSLRKQADDINALANEELKDYSKREQIANHLQRHFSYIMEPTNEWAGLRSLGFTYYLGYNIKSATINLTQVPFVTYPHLAARYGDTKALRALGDGGKQALNFFRDPQRVSPDVRRLVVQGISEGWLDESLATELAINASHGRLERALPFNWREARTMGRYTWFKLAEYGALPFHTVEKFNRFTSAIARYNLARERGETHDRAVRMAQETVQKTQFEYARWARPEIMRGKKGALFLFKSYTQGTLFFLYNDPGAWRYMMILAMAGGLLGLPFAEDLIDGLDWLGTKFKSALGMKDPYVDLKTQLRKDLGDLADEIHANPDLFLRGISSQTFGLALLNGMGIPVPELDLSGSISQGNLLPLTDVWRRAPSHSVEEMVGYAAEDVGGALGSMFAGLASPFIRNDPDTWRRLERALPLAARGPSKSLRLALQGRETTVSGATIAEFDLEDPRDAAELAFQTFGYTPRRVSRGWEARIATLMAMSYWDAQKAHLLQQHNVAWALGDREAKADTLKGILEYNRTVPYPEMSISSEVINKSLKTYLGRRITQDLGFPLKEMYFRLEQDYKRAYGLTAEGDSPDTEKGTRPAPETPSSQ